MRCIGLTKNMKRCERNCKFFLCNSHKFQWYALIAIILTFVGFFNDIILPIKSRLSSLFNNEILFEGEWNDSLAYKSLIKILLKYNFKDFGYTSNILYRIDEIKPGGLDHKLIGFYSIHDGTKDMTIALFASHPFIDNFSDCHACGVKVSIFELENINKKWKIRN